MDQNFTKKSEYELLTKIYAKLLFLTAKQVICGHLIGPNWLRKWYV